MLIEILDDVANSADLTERMTDDARDGLINLATAVYEGNHIIAATPQTLGRALQLSTKLGMPTIDRLRHAKSAIKDAYAMKSAVCAYIEVFRSGTAPTVVTRLGTAPQVIFRVGLDYFSRSLRTQASRLVGEDERDAQVYRAFGLAMATKFRGVRCSLKPISGGGKNTHRAFASYSKEGPTLCIVDTDRLSPTDPLKDTARDALAAFERLRADQHVADLHILPCHELENLLPEDLVLAAIPRDAERTHREMVREHRDRLGRCDYVDLKEVLVGCPILAWVNEFVTTNTPHSLHKMCFSSEARKEVLEVGMRVLSFGLALKPGRT